jgi:hypothetical protein
MFIPLAYALVIDAVKLEVCNMFRAHFHLQEVTTGRALFPGIFAPGLSVVFCKRRVSRQAGVRFQGWEAEGRHVPDKDSIYNTQETYIRCERFTQALSHLCMLFVSMAHISRHVPNDRHYDTLPYLIDDIFRFGHHQF